MQLRYMVEYALRDRDTNPHYEPIGVWVQGPGPGLDIVMDYLPGNDRAQEEADWVINRLVENDFRSLPEDFLEYHRQAMSSYRGMRAHVVETGEFTNCYELAQTIKHALMVNLRANGAEVTTATAVHS